MIDPEHLWHSFVIEFKKHLDAASESDLKNAWSTHTNRTRFYRKILSNVSQGLGFEIGPEEFTVDFVMWTSGTEERVPLMFIESENSVTTAIHEIRKLACLTAPLRVLITVVEWDEIPGVWKGGGMRSKLLSEWEAIIRRHNFVWPRVGLLGLIVGEWRPDDTLRFYANAFRASGALLKDSDQRIVDRNMRNTAKTVINPR
jgi:hypothetical protein